ncbi:hypothetical protein FOCC_FOCC001141 [Frankliniella occidentalis]|uniref:Trypsin-1 n=1 Tax=Frankliniella occidentalis TaxID=133901 RepID=A0A6J1S525_FRAOC|nr:trypsin-1 [Frankliniella occidentalis]KAE8751978.1 hypothetical protein FOCC_FOCC001141 [Frankliniella occidentalis]
MAPLTFLAVALAFVAAASGANVKVFNFARDPSLAAAEPSIFAWAPLGLDKTFVPSTDDQIVGGKDAKRNQFPHQASMQVSVPGYPKPQHICGGTLIADTWVLTAAHCVYGVPSFATGVSVVLGITSLTKDDGQRLTVEQAMVHAQYDPQANVGPYDIALLKLKGKAQLNKGVKIAQLPKANAIPKGKAILSGWGSTSQDGDHPVYPDKLQTLDFPVVDFKTCYDYITDISPKEPNPLTDTNLCVGDLKKTGLSSCSGDSGGPLIQKDGWFGEKTVVVGVVSWGLKNCGSIPFPSVFTRVSAYNEWINLIMKNYQ